MECISNVREGSSVGKEYVNDGDFTVSCGSLSRAAGDQSWNSVSVYAKCMKESA
jgi:hypothetical protein